MEMTKKATLRQPKISVVIFSYNFENYISECIESILSQTYRPLEIIISDDHSTDKSYEIINKFQTKYPEIIRAYQHNENIGHQKNANFALSKSTGEYIARIDGDDRWLAQKLEVELKFLNYHPECKIAYSNVFTINEMGNHTGIWHSDDSAIPPSGDIFIQTFSKNLFVGHRNLYRNELMHKSVYKKIGEVDESLKILVDYDLKVRSTAHFPVIYTNETLIEYRLHGGGIHNSSPADKFKDILKIYKKNKDFLINRTNDEINIVKNGIKQKLAELISIDNFHIDFSAEENNILTELGFKTTDAKCNIHSNDNTIYANCAEPLDPISKSKNLKQNKKTVKSKRSYKGRTLAHIVNPASVPVESDLYCAQPITFETMRKAKEYAVGKVDVTLYSAHYPEDKNMVPDDFVSSECLARSVMDVGRFEKQRKLPLIADILDRLYKSSDAEYLIYTNSDISLKRDFYTAVDNIIQQGYDAFIINRRTIPDTYRKIEEIPLMYKEFGKPHPGYDCFVFKRNLYPKFRLRNICIGINYVGLALLKNLECHAKQFKVFKDLHLTFHIGNDKPWKNDEYSDYRKHNEYEYYKVLKDLGKEIDSDQASNTQTAENSKLINENHSQVKFETHKIFEKVRERNMFFVLSTGRSGTKTIAESLSGLPECLCLHEPAPQLILESSAYRYGRLEDEKLRQFLLQTRQPIVNGKIYGESNQTLSLIVPVLAKSFPNAKFIWLIRNGLDVVSSIFARQWYTGHSANHDRYEDCPPLEKAWIDGRIMGDLCRDVPITKWKKMNPFARCCWYWTFINRTIEKDLIDHCSEDSHKKLKLEEIDLNLPKIVNWLGFNPSPAQQPGRHNRAHYRLYPWQKWTPEERKTFLYWCGPLMDRLYPDWRIINEGFLNNLHNPSKSVRTHAEKNVTSKILADRKNFSKTELEKLNICYTPQFRTRPKISVYITSYNQKQYLIEAIESVLAQSLKPHEIIIVDDCSNDDSQQLIANYAQKYPNLIFPIYHSKNFGVVRTRLDALNTVTGDFVTYVDGDDRFLPEKLEHEFEILASNPNAQIAFSNNYYINTAGQPIGIWAEEDKPPQGYIFKETFGRIFPKNSLFRMELVNYQAWKAVGFHDPAITIYEDFDMRIRMTKHFQAAFCDEPLSEIRMHDKGLSNLEAKQHLASLEFIFQKNRYLLDDITESDREIAKNGFYNFVDNISMVAANQLAEIPKREKQNSHHLLHNTKSTSSNKEQPGGQTELGSNLIFLISQPRAGSTLLQRLLAGHPEIHTTAEPWIMLHPLYALKENGIVADYRADLAQQGLVDFLGQVPEGIDLYKTALRKFGSTLYNRALELSEKQFFLDKTPRYYHIIPELSSIFPEAKFIFLLRNPIAVLSSILKTWYSNRVADIQIQNLIDMVKGPVCVLDGIKRLKEKAIVVEYESLVKSPETVMLRVCNRIGISYYQEMLDYGQNPKPKGRFGDSVGIYKHQRPVTDNIDKWLRNLSSPELVEFSIQYLDVLGSDIISKMGYNFKELKQQLNYQKQTGEPLQTNPYETKILNAVGENFLASNVEAQNRVHQVKAHKKDRSPEETDSVDPVEVKDSSEKFLVSAIVSTYNSERFIRSCLEDLENQTIAEKLEIIVVNSGSLQNEEKIVKEFQAKYSNIEYIETNERETVYAAWNRGVKAATGKYITTANTDDRHRTDAFERLADELENNPDIGLVYADVFVTNYENQVFGEHIHCGYHIRPEFSPEIMLSGCHMGPQPMWRKKIHAKVGYFDTKYKSAGDYDFWCRIALQYPMKHVSEFLGLYYENPNGICNSQKDLSVAETSVIKNTYFSQFPSPEKQQQYINNYQFDFHLPDNSYVNICMVTFNRLDFTKQAIESIIKYTRYPHVITVVDNNSKDGSREYLKKLHKEGRIKNLILLDENVGVAKASNLGWNIEPEAEYYLKLDNDIVLLKADWLTKMIHTVEAIPKIGAIAYNFEPQSYPLTEINGIQCRVKEKGNLGGACILIPHSTKEQLGYWCEDYGLYGEEDADYDFRIKCKGLLTIYMQDENIGLHLPGGKAAAIDPQTYRATDGQEEIQQAEYRKWKDDMRRNNVMKGKFFNYLNEYMNGTRPLFVTSQFADQYFKERCKSVELRNKIKRQDIRSSKFKVSIIIPVFNQIDFTKKCLTAIFKNTPPDLYEIIIINNASTDGTVRYLSSLRDRIKVITNEQNMGFAKACNQGAGEASGEYLLFLNNDTEVQHQWLNYLVEVLEKDESVAAAGSKMLFPDKTIQHAGVAIFNNQQSSDPLTARHIYCRQPDDYPKANEMSTYQALTAACLLIRRSAFEAVNGFDEQYWNGYEDIDLCFKIQKKGWLLVYQPKSVVTHYESQSGPERFSRVQHNVERLHQKWLGKINPDLIITPEGDVVETGAGCIRPYQMKKCTNQKLTQSTTLNKKCTSVIILTCNQIEYTQKCIESIFKHTLKPFELIVVDNGSTDGTVEYLKSEVQGRNTATRIKIIENIENNGFAGGNNQGMAVAGGDYIVLMNNDVVVTPGWLERLIRCAERKPQIGIVGPCSNYVSGSQLIKDVPYDLTGLDGLSEFSNQFAKRFSGQVQPTLRVVGFCMLIKRTVIDKIGGMDNRYGLGNFEDDDFSLRATIAGFESWIARDCFIHHFGHRTFVGEQIDLQKSLLKNWEVFKEKWGLAAEMPYGTPYRLADMQNTQFDPSIHFYPLEKGNDIMENASDDDKTAEDAYRAIQTNFSDKHSNEIIEALENLINAHPKFAAAYNDLGVLNYNAGHKERAHRFYQKAVKLDPNNPVFSKNLADFYCIELGRIEEALQIYVNILRSHPDDTETLMATGQICVALGKPSDAMAFFNRALEIEPWNDDVRKAIEKLDERSAEGKVKSPSPEEMYQNIKRHLSTFSTDEAIEHFQKLVESYPDFAMGHNDLGVLHYNEGHKENALKHYQLAAQLQPENITFRKNLADFLFVEMGKVEEALDIYVDILATNPQDVETLLITGHICVSLKRFEEARVFYNRVLELEPDNSDAKNNIHALNIQKTEDNLFASEFANNNLIAADEVEPHNVDRHFHAIRKPEIAASIIMDLDGVHNCVKECIKSIQTHTFESYELIFVNRGASKGILKWAQELVKNNDNYEIIKCNPQTVWAESVNQAIKKAHGEMIFLVHNDIVVPKGWLRAFKTCFNRIPNIGVVGPMSNETSGIQQMIFSDESERVLFESAAEAFYQKNQYRRVSTSQLSDFCLAFHGKLLEKIGYLDDQFASREIAVEDLCNRVASAGYQNLIAADTYVYHYDRHKVKNKSSVKIKLRTEDRKELKAKLNRSVVKSLSTKNSQATHILTNAKALSEKGKIDMAIEMLLSGIGIQPQIEMFYLALAEILVRAKRFQDAKDVLLEMPTTDESLITQKAELLGYAEEGLGNYEAAHAHIDQVSSVNPSSATALNLKGILTFRNQDRKSAEQFFRDALASDPGYGEPYTNLGILKLAEEKEEAALKLFEKGFILSPFDFDIATNYHSLISQLNDYQRAEKIAREASALYPYNQKIKYLLIDCLVQLGNYDEAMQEIETAIVKFGVEDGILSAALKIRESLDDFEIQEIRDNLSVSLCMIVKDEEKYLAQCLASVKPIVDEMIVVDTGSTDKTKDIARTFGAKVYDYEWHDNFAEARNFSISKANGHWIFIMDADEVISPQDYNQFAKIVGERPKTAVAYSFNTRNYNKLANMIGWTPNDGRYPDEEAASGWLPSSKVRLFSGKDQIWFEGAVHEMVDPVIKRNGIRVKQCSIPIHHYGRLNKEHVNRKDEVYFEIGKKKLEDMGDDINAIRELAIQATNMEKNEEALKLWEKLLSLNLKPKSVSETYINLGTIYNRMGNFQYALDAAKKAVENAPDLKEARYNYAVAELHSGDLANSIVLLKELLLELPDYLPAQFILAAAYCCSGDTETGLAKLSELKATPMGTFLVYSCAELAKGLMTAQRHSYALNLISTAMECEIVNAEILNLFADCIRFREDETITETNSQLVRSELNLF